MWQDFTQYILNESGEENVKIAEVGVGKFSQVADALEKKDNITVIRTDILPADGIMEEELLQTAFSLEQKSEHPLICTGMWI